MNPGSQFSQLKNSRPAFPRDVAFTSWVFTLSACLVMLTACGSHSGPEPAGPVPEIRDFNESYEPVIDSIVQLLTLDEKIALLHGNSKFSSPGVERPLFRWHVLCLARYRGRTTLRKEWGIFEARISGSNELEVHASNADQ